MIKYLSGFVCISANISIYKSYCLSSWKQDITFLDNFG